MGLIPAESSIRIKGLDESLSSISFGIRLETTSIMALMKQALGLAHPAVARAFIIWGCSIEKVAEKRKQ